MILKNCLPIKSVWDHVGIDKVLGHQVCRRELTVEHIIIEMQDL